MSWNIAKPGDQINGPVAVTGNLNVDSNTLFVDSATNRVGVLTASPTVPLDVVGDAKVSGNLTVDTNTLVVDAANNRLGIGTATPATALHVFGTGSQALSVERDGATIQSRLEIISGNSTNLIRATVAKDLLVEQGTGTEVLRIATNGVCTWSNVVNAGTAMTLNGTGLGVGGSIFSNSKLTLVSAAGVDCMLALQKTGGSNTSVMMTDGTNAWLGSSSGSTGKKLIYALAAPDNSVVVDSSGNVGIGIATPSGKLHVEGANIVLKNGTGVPFFQIAGRNTDGKAEFNFLNNGLSVNNAKLVGYTNTLAFEVAGSERLRIDSSGNLGLGTSTANFRADIQNASGAAVLRLKGGTGAAQGSAVYMTYAGGANTLLGIGDRATILGGAPDQLACIYSGVALTFEISGAERLRLKTTGQVNFVGLASDPAGAAAGDVYYNTTTNKLKCYNGTTWNDLF